MHSRSISLSLSFLRQLSFVARLEIKFYLDLFMDLSPARLRRPIDFVSCLSEISFSRSFRAIFLIHCQEEYYFSV